VASGVADLYEESLGLKCADSFTTTSPDELSRGQYSPPWALDPTQPRSWAAENGADLWPSFAGGPCFAGGPNSFVAGKWQGLSWDSFFFRAPLSGRVYASTIAGLDHYYTRTQPGQTAEDRHQSQYQYNTRVPVYMNMIGAENYLGKLLTAANMTLLSPCQFIRAEHWDCTGRKSHKLNAKGHEFTVRMSWRQETLAGSRVARCRTMHACQLKNPKQGAQAPCEVHAI